MTKTKNILDITNAIAENTTNYAFNIFIPSLKENVRFKEMTISQQKNIVKSMLDRSIMDINFSDTLLDIISANCVDDVDPLSFTIIDKVVIALGLRINSLDAVIKSSLKTKNNTDIKFDIDLNVLYDEVQTKMKSFDYNPKTISIGNIEVVCEVPKLSSERATNKYYSAVNQDITEQSDESDIKNAVGNAFINEIIKYISAVTITKNDGEVLEINWDELSVGDRVKVTSNLSTKVLKEVITYIEVVKAQLDGLYLWNFTLNDEKFKHQLELNADFFMIS